MPAPEENHAELYEHLLRRNDRLVGAHFSIGVEDAVFLRGELPLALLDEARARPGLGTLYATVEQCFRPALRIGFASRFALTRRPSRRPLHLVAALHIGSRERAARGHHDCTGAGISGGAIHVGPGCAGRLPIRWRSGTHPCGSGGFGPCRGSAARAAGPAVP